MPKSHYDTGFPNEVTLRNIPALNMQTWDSHAFWVDYEKGSDANNGDVKSPFKTLNHAIEACEANNGDQIYVAPNHSETIANATSLLANVAGIEIFGLGVGDDRPTIYFSHPDAKIQITAPDIYLSNMIFRSSYVGIEFFLHVESKRFIVQNCSFISTSTLQSKNYIYVSGVSINDCDGFRAIGCEFYAASGTGLVQEAIKFDQTIKDVYIINCKGFGYFGNAIIFNPLAGSGKDIENIIIDGGFYENTAIDKYAIRLNQDLSGIITKRTEMRSVGLHARSYLTSKIEQGSSGDIYIFEKVVGFSSITTAGTDLSSLAVGDLFIESVLVETGANAMATSTNIQLRHDGGTGNPIFWEEAVSNLTAFQSIDLDHASIVGSQARIKEGTNLQIKATGADATAGNLSITIVFRRLADGAFINNI